MSKNVILKERTANGFEEIYPKTSASQIIDGVWTKNETLTQEVAEKYYLGSASKNPNNIIDKLSQTGLLSTTREMRQDYGVTFNEEDRIIYDTTYNELRLSEELVIIWWKYSNPFTSYIINTTNNTITPININTGGAAYNSGNIIYAHGQVQAALYVNSVLKDLYVYNGNNNSFEYYTTIENYSSIGICNVSAVNNQYFGWYYDSSSNSRLATSNNFQDWTQHGDRYLSFDNYCQDIANNKTYILYGNSLRYTSDGSTYTLVDNFPSEYNSSKACIHLVGKGLEVLGSWNTIGQGMSDNTYDSVFIIGNKILRSYKTGFQSYKSSRIVYDSPSNTYYRFTQDTGTFYFLKYNPDTDSNWIDTGSHASLTITTGAVTYYSNNTLYCLCSKLYSTQRKYSYNTYISLMNGEVIGKIPTLDTVGIPDYSNPAVLTTSSSRGSLSLTYTIANTGYLQITYTGTATTTKELKINNVLVGADLLYPISVGDIVTVTLRRSTTTNFTATLNLIPYK